MHDVLDFVVLISAGTEWQALLPHFPDAQLTTTPFGDFFQTKIDGSPIIFIHAGWGKVSTAGATQYAIDRWQPRLMVNLGTCGGFEGLVDLNAILLADETVIYDIIEGMSDYEQAIQKYTTTADLTWLGEDIPKSIIRTKLLSADRDIRPQDVPMLIKEFDGIAADWESGAFAWVAERNQVDWLVLRGVSDLVSASHGEALENVVLWQQRTTPIMAQLLDFLPWVIKRYRETHE